MRCGSRKLGKVAIFAQSRDPQSGPPGAGVPIPVAVVVPLSRPHRCAGAFDGARPHLHLGFHDPLGGKGRHIAHKVAIGLFLNELNQRLCRRSSEYPPTVPGLAAKPSPKTGCDHQRHPWLRAVLRQGFWARPSIPRNGAQSPSAAGLSMFPVEACNFGPPHEASLLSAGTRRPITPASGRYDRPAPRIGEARCTARLGSARAVMVRVLPVGHRPPGHIASDILARIIPQTLRHLVRRHQQQFRLGHQNRRYR